jgi:fibronectin type 3 domain-containing protein
MKSSSSIRISWGVVSGRSGYELWRAASEGGEYTLVKSTSSRSYTDKNLVPNITYYYKVRAYVTVGGTRVYSDFSSLASAMPVFASVSSAKAVRKNATGIKLTWSAVSGRSGYEVWRATSADGEYTLIKSITSTKYTNTGLTTGTTYYYKIRAYKTIGGVRYYSDFSAVVSATP